MTKRSTNFSHTRKPRKPISDAARFLRDLGYTDEQIMAQLFATPQFLPAQAEHDSERTDDSQAERP